MKDVCYCIDVQGNTTISTSTSNFGSSGRVDGLLEEAFKIKEYPDFIKINMKSATWAKKKPDKTNVMYLNKDNVLSLLEYVLNNIYVKYRDNIFRQVIGVPMGTDCAPNLANLFLFALEYKYIPELIDVKVMILSGLNSYIDTLMISWF